MRRLYYVAPQESMGYILRNGILTPLEVSLLISVGKLPSGVLGVSYGAHDSSNFPRFVSLLKDERITKTVAEAICFSRTGKFNDPNFRAYGYSVSIEIENMKGFVDEEETKKMNPDSYPSEVLFAGNIEPKFISKHVFSVRPRLI